MIERLLIAAGIMTLGVVAWIILNRLNLRRIGSQANADSLLESLRPGIPVVVYFTTPFCAPCRAQQQPALKALEHEMGDQVQVIKVDAVECPEIADRWGVFSAPTTFVLDGRFQPRHVNRGVATTEILKRQIQTVA